ncbi:MAG: hypothetical protein ACLGPL_02290, partial [Acidobacteriota bacterium]
MKKMVRGKWFVLCFLVASALAGFAMAGAQEKAQSVAIVPFAVHGQQDAGATRSAIVDILTRRLEGEGVKVVEPQRG